MKSTLLLQIALWASSTHAFYPWRPDWVDAREKSGRRGLSPKLDMKRAGQTPSTPQHAQREAARLAAKYRRRDPSHAKRDNDYFVLEAEDPDHDFAVGIDQDGSDFSYFVEVQVGSEGKNLYMLLDTGAGSTWIMGSDCTTEACAIHNSYGPEDSDTFEQGTDTFSIAYGSGSVKGTFARDTFNVAGMSFDLEFGVANETSEDFIHFPFDGILGMSMNEGVGESFLAVMAEDGDVEANIFAVSLHRADDGPNTGEIRFGSTNPDLYEGDISYTPIATEGDWAVEVDEMAFDGNAAGVGGMTCYIDTGTTFIFGPPDAVEMLHGVIPGAEAVGDDGKMYTVPCDTEDLLTFTFSGVSYEIHTSDWISPANADGVCTSNVYGQEFVEGAWVLGDAFLKNVYAVFDADERSIGFASQVQETQTTSSLTTTMSMTSMPTSSEIVLVTTITASNSTIVATATIPNPSMGMGGQETHSSEDGPAETGAGQQEGDGDSSALARPANARCAAVFGIAAVIALVA